MKTPVVIAAFNEEAFIGPTLNALDNKTCEPIVVANGCDDSTADIARNFGVSVIERAEQGKLPAIQEALRCLGERALGPVLFLDADSQPRFPKLWVNAMQKGVDVDGVHVRAGSISYMGGSLLDDIGWTVKAQLDACKALKSEVPRYCGANMLTQMRHERVLGKILELPHIWLGEDHAIGTTISDHDGVADQTVDLRANVKTSARFLPPVTHVICVGAEEAKKELGEQYKERAAPGSITYRSYMMRRKRAKKTRI